MQRLNRVKDMDVICCIPNFLKVIPFNSTYSIESKNVKRTKNTSNPFYSTNDHREVGQDQSNKSTPSPYHPAIVIRIHDTGVFYMST